MRQPDELPAGGFAFPEVFNAARRNLGAHLVHFSGHEAKGIGVFKQEHGRQHKGASLHIGIRHAAFAAVAHPQFAPAFLVVLRAVLKIPVRASGHVSSYAFCATMKSMYLTLRFRAWECEVPEKLCVCAPLPPASAHVIVPRFGPVPAYRYDL